ncbi:hypothetical protein BGP77_16200 [Saccharospirillum sp. MSK14-1]|uniref:dienelactone hydrolase family protein n=1 Tax=Saccharospirillum sp. MSK14-1 TaxID=1897632 RepID=UPI000D3B768E|nr:dienelactone hydrolase family protein [Saccharospirillum sp. MSK14-1]PTY37998.1 hypothetical protein BGP77_16200 [Saccharospirillum sp. MSK14-1]
MSSQPDGYTAFSTVDEAPGVLVLHAWWGLNKDVRDYCDALAQAGFNAFAPDFYQGQVVTTVEAAEAAGDALDHQQATQRLVTAADWLAGKTGERHSGVAAVGFSLGAFLALGVSINHADLLHSVISYYAARPDDYGSARARYLAHMAQSDAFATEAEIDAWQDVLAAAGRSLALHRYPQTGHWFAEPSRPDAYQPAAAELAWQRTLSFLRSGQAD